MRKNPIDQFHEWLEEAIHAHILEPNAMVLATANKEGRPSSRTVLLKKYDASGLIFFTNTESRKAKELQENPYASATFLWKEIHRQVCIDAKVEKISHDDTASYFASRPRGSQLGAWASKQGTILSSREELDKEFQRLDTLYHDQEIPLPPFWGGFKMIPYQFNFWQGRLNRLHDRFMYLLQEDTWEIFRLSP